REVEQPVALKSQLFVQLIKFRLQRVETLDLRGIARLVVNKWKHTVKIRRRFARFLFLVFFKGLSYNVPKCFVRHRSARRPDDGIFLRHVTETGEAMYRGKQLSTAEIPRCAKDHKCERFLKVVRHATAYNGLWYN